MRISVDRARRETSDVTTMPTMNHAAMCRPSAAADDVDDRRVDEDERDRHEADALRRLRDRHRNGRRRHQHQHAGRVRAALLIDVRLKMSVTTPR
jgi:hypothetical protein